MNKRISDGLGRYALLLVAAAAAGYAQDLGTVQLPADLAAPDAKVLGVLNKAPSNGADLAYSEGPAVDAEGNLYFTEMAGPSRIWKVPPTGAANLFLPNSSGSNGLEIDPQGRLVAVQSRKVTRFDKDGSTTELAAGENLKNLNDLSIGSTGAMFLSNYDGGSVFFRPAAGGTLKETRLPGSNPNGVEWVEEKKTLYVNYALDNPNGKVVKYAVAGDGTLSNPAEFAKVNVPDGLTLDELGNVYIAAHGDGTVEVYSPGGALLGKITIRGGSRGNTSNCAFGGPDNKTLYITGNKGAFKVALKVAGRRRPASVGIGHGPLPADASGLRLSRGALRPGQGLSISLPGAPGLAVSIRDAASREIWNGSASGRSRLEWDGRSSAGAALAPGRYLVSARSGARAASAPVLLLGD